MFSRSTQRNDIKNEEETEEVQNANQEVDLGTIGNYFDQVRNNYFEVKKVIWAVGEIEWDMAIPIIQRLCFYDDGTKDPVTIYISSPGGDCYAGFAIIDAIEELKRKGIVVNTICCGSCLSMATTILASGTKGHRYAFPSSRVMVHEAGVPETGGKLSDINIVQKELQNWTDAMNKVFKKQTGKSMEDLKKMVSFDNFMSAQEAKKLGLIDKIKTYLV